MAKPILRKRLELPLHASLWRDARTPCRASRSPSDGCSDVFRWFLVVGSSMSRNHGLYAPTVNSYNAIVGLLGTTAWRGSYDNRTASFRVVESAKVCDRVPYSVRTVILTLLCRCARPPGRMELRQDRTAPHLRRRSLPRRASGIPSTRGCTELCHQ